MRIHLKVLVASLFMFLSSCGGGEGSPTGATSSQAGGATSATSSTTTSIVSIDPVLEGVWQGAGTANTVVLAAALNRGAFWLIYGKPFGALPAGTKAATTWKGFLSVDGFIRGSVSTKAGTVTSEDLLNFDMTETISPLKMAGNYAAGSFNATLTASEATTSVVTIAPPATSFVYSEIPRLESILGDWKGAELLGKSNDARLSVVAGDTYGKVAQILLSVGGLTVQGASVTGCSFAGTIEPRKPSVAAENIFDFNLDGSSGCGSRARKTFTGIGIVQRIEQGKMQFILLGTSIDGLGLLFSGLPSV